MFITNKVMHCSVQAVLAWHIWSLALCIVFLQSELNSDSKDGRTRPSLTPFVPMSNTLTALRLVQIAVRVPVLVLGARAAMRAEKYQVCYLVSEVCAEEVAAGLARTCGWFCAQPTCTLN